MGNRAGGWMAIALVGGLACGDDSESRPDAAPRQVDAAPFVCPDDEPDAVRVGNNSAVLHGVGFGKGEEAVGVLRKPVEVDLTSPSSLEVGRAWAMRAFGSHDGAYLAIEVSNPTGELLCRIVAQPYQWRDADGGAIETRERVFLTGSVADEAPLYSNTCLAPGETGYLLDINLEKAPAAFVSLATVALELDFTTEGAALPEAEIVPTGYTTGELGRLRIAFENVGTGEATIGPDTSLSVLVLLDDGGAPLLWSTLDTDLSPEDGVVAAGGEGTVDAVFEYAGCAASVRPFLGFTP